MDLKASMKIAASGMQAQTDRMRVISENLANANSTALRPGEEPYRRKVVTFKQEFDKAVQANTVEIGKIKEDKTPFTPKFIPGHPAADANGYVLMPNVDPIIEMNDMREAQRSYEANLGMIETSRTMLRQTIDLLN